MHSLHHSAEALDAHHGRAPFRLEQMVITVFLPIGAILLKTPSEVIAAASFLYFFSDILSTAASLHGRWPTREVS